MKTKMKTMFVFFLAAAFAVSCGKNESGGSNSNNWSVGGSYNVGSNVDSQSRQVFEQARSWFNNASQEGQLNQNGGNLYPSKFTRADFTLSNACRDLEVFGINLGEWIQRCSSNYNIVNGSLKTVCFQSQYNNNNTTTLRIGSSNGDVNCNGMTITGNYTKQSNTELAKVLSLNGNNWVLQGAQAIGGVYQIAVGPNTTNTFGSQISYIYVIDTRFHSIYNPVQIIDNTQSKTNSLNNY